MARSGCALDRESEWVRHIEEFLIGFRTRSVSLSRVLSGSPWTEYLTSSPPASIASGMVQRSSRVPRTGR